MPATNAKTGSSYADHRRCDEGSGEELGHSRTALLFLREDLPCSKPDIFRRVTLMLTSQRQSVWVGIDKLENKVLGDVI
ncbi:hypothetical protein ROHU_025456 [Labeo rohita]|uniref:Uncharacterized protein n=1 Tax=Labeo rohita TaxID=84645 RepID=A0A498MEW9_LABRO|nr:hypothetical protein ROHU_025456 [Labeo rohita]